MSTTKKRKNLRCKRPRLLHHPFQSKLNHRLHKIRTKLRYHSYVGKFAIFEYRLRGKFAMFENRLILNGTLCF